LSFATPEWVKEAIFYQIFPDRFARSARMTAQPGISLKPWGSSPSEEGFQGGDLYGIIDKLDHLQSLQVNALYLTPVFASASNHRYHPYDYFNVDPLLGGNDALRALLDACHERGIRVVLDAVLNHTGRGFWPFHHILENGGNSPYRDWFHIHDWPLRPYSSDKDNHHNYDSWWNLPELPKLNTSNPGVRQYLLNVAKYWIEFGADGWRIDAAGEIKDDSFWQEFRNVVKSVNPDAWLCGEEWYVASKWLKGDMFDAVMNYPLGTAAISFFGKSTLRTGYFPDPSEELVPLNAEQFAGEIKTLQSAYGNELLKGQLNSFGSHDTARIFWTIGDNQNALKQLVLFQMTAPGAPCIYYGDEIGMSSAGLPHCREAVPWDELAQWNQPVLDFYREYTALRRQFDCLQTGEFDILYAEGDVFAFTRIKGEQCAVIAFNTGDRDESLVLDLPAKAESFKGYVGNAEFRETEDKQLVEIALPANGSLLAVTTD